MYKDTIEVRGNSDIIQSFAFTHYELCPTKPTHPKLENNKLQNNSIQH
jgi:hypothetical protein